MRGTIAWPPDSGQLGLGGSVISYAGEVIVGALADDRLIQQPRRLLAEICSEFSQFGVEPAR